MLRNSVLMISAVLSYLLSGAIAFAHCGIPTDQSGDTIPSPTGNIPYFKLPDALCGGTGEFTWDYSGTLANNNQPFSFQSSIFQIANGLLTGVGFHIFQFAFKEGNQFFYANSTYGGDSEDKVLTAIGQSVDWINSLATLPSFLVHTTNMLNPSAQWTVESYLSPIPQPPLYKGLVGQPGHQYQMKGTGNTFLWRYNATSGDYTIAPYTYNVNLIMLDERGGVMEGLGGGYVGPTLIPNPLENSYLVESEIAQPRLRVTSWQVQLTANGAPQTGFNAQYTFSGNEGMLWNDFGPVFTAQNKVITLKNQKMDSFTRKIQSKLSRDQSLILNSATNTRSSALYNGNWLPVTFTSGKYQGSSIVFFTFWNKTVPYPNDQTTNDPLWSTVGWTNLFTGVVPEKVASASSLLATLYAENPNQPSSFIPSPSYSVKLNTFVPLKFHSAFPWAQQVTLTVKANSKLRYALADYANTYYPQLGADDPTQDLVIVLNAISPVTQNTLFSPSFSQYYEGAAIPTINGNNVGYAWIEHMVKN